MSLPHDAGAGPGLGAAVQDAAAVRVEHVSVSYGPAQILADVSLRVAAGEVVALVGPNGAGKSTLLAAVAGDVRPSAGRVVVGELDAMAAPARALARVRAVQLQEATLSFAFTARAVVEMGRAPWQGGGAPGGPGSFGPVDDDALVVAAMGRSEVLHLAERRFPTLSGGEKARVSFARVLAQTTPVLLLDEPTAALDIRHQEALLEEVRVCADVGCAVVVVLHDLSLAGAYADRIALLSHGRVRADGPPRSVLTPQLLTEVYGHPVDVVDHPNSPGPVVLPVRRRRTAQKKEYP
ncbi:iron complex transport system ATP-binding protein [Salana multivorans]|uniref:Iron complex transport system ATP-binding protein n=1 Tax=Salana multivorans TaxID=120377 RepID=A0A3N2D9S4_9MICO|nr:heme ABC transporter ATP-binding protein [Salana multivorans]ROR96546.1 iron complex transport system ATP-binding protein [Salana multivorans]